MNQYVTGAVIKELREKYHLTQAELAEKLNVSDKTVSKWETAKGYPDISLLEPIAKVFGISVTELISGNAVNNVNVSANMMRSKFELCAQRVTAGLNKAVRNASGNCSPEATSTTETGSSLIAQEKSKISHFSAYL